MHDYGYLENMGMGIHLKIMPGMKGFNGTEPVFQAEEETFTIVFKRDSP